MQPILETHRLTKTYANQRGIRDVNLQLHEGDIYGLLGPNGAGKTTLLKLITGLVRPDQGTVVLFQGAYGNPSEQGLHHVGCMIEAADFYDFVTGQQYLELVARYHSSTGPGDIEAALDEVGLNHAKKDKIRGYSTGMKQKLALAAAILPKPRLVILDEPTNGLDVEGIVMFRKLITRLSRERSTTFLISSHMIHELEQLCNRVGLMTDGRLRQEGHVSELLQNQSLEQYYISQLELLKERKAGA
ncbi:ABC transporter ATP-binding protein [Paenibacillus sp. y28]|uniref:ABC transporter ATP-binding protein n=1 Tax=Paenibacillus sp. y28 TaxID=3129110 RepID=UPI003016DD94